MRLLIHVTQIGIGDCLQVMYIYIQTATNNEIAIREHMIIFVVHALQVRLGYSAVPQNRRTIFPNLDERMA